MEAQSSDGRMFQLPPTTVQDVQEALGRPSPGATKMIGPPRSRRSPPPPPLPVTLSQAEEGSATAAARDSEEQRHKAEAKEGIEAGGTAAVFGFTVLSGCLCLPKEAKRSGNVRFTISLFLAFATFLSGKALMLLSMNMLGLREDFVSGGQHVAAQCLIVACASLPVLTLLSLVALLPSRLYQYIGLAVVTVVLLPAAGVHWYMRRRSSGGRDEATTEDDEHKEELENASKTTSCVTNSAFAGLVGVLFSVSKISGAAAGSVDRAAYAATFFMFATAILGMFLMTVSNRVPEITNRRCRHLFVTTIKLGNAVLLCSLACAAFAAAFVVLRYRVFAAFAPLVTTAILCFLLRHCVVDRRGRAGGANRSENQRARVKAVEELGSKVTTATLGAIMSVLGGSLGEKGHENAGGTGVVVVVVTSAFVSGFGFMLLAAAPGSARERLAPAARVLVWSSVALFASTAVVVYGVEAWAM